MPGLVEKTRIPIWVIPEKFVAEAARRRGVGPDDMVVAEDDGPGVLLRPGLGAAVLDDAIALYRMAAASAPGYQLPFTPLFQEHTQWCWIAVALSVARFYTTPLSGKDQCEVANDVLGQFTCCGNGDSLVCNVARPLEHSLDHLGVTYSTTPSDVEFDVVKSEVAAWHPTCWRLDWGNDKGHFGVIDGWEDGDDGPHLLVEDPAPEFGFAPIPLSDVLGGIYRGHPCTWDTSYLTRRPDEDIRVADEVWDQVRASSDALADGGVS